VLPAAVRYFAAALGPVVWMVARVEGKRGQRCNPACPGFDVGMCRVNAAFLRRDRLAPSRPAAEPQWRDGYLTLRSPDRLERALDAGMQR
jgi:hypothetical protein